MKLFWTLAAVLSCSIATAQEAYVDDQGIFRVRIITTTDPGHVTSEHQVSRQHRIGVASSGESYLLLDVDRQHRIASPIETPTSATGLDYTYDYSYPGIPE